MNRRLVCDRLPVEREALSLIHFLRDQSQPQSEWLAALSADQTLSEPVRQRALQSAREEREQLFGDEPEDVREQTSIIARLVLYAATIEAMFPTQPLAASLPGLFPSGGSPAALPTFRFNWRQEPDGSLTTWLEVPRETRKTCS